MESPRVAPTAQDPELRRLLARARKGDAEAWGELYRRFAPAIERFCRHALANPQDAEDATGDIFIKLRAKLGQYDPERPFSPWLYRLAGNYCWDLLRQRNRRGFETEAGDDLPLPAAPGQLDEIMARQSAEAMRRALEQLPERSRLALTLRYYSELSYEEIAEVLRLPRGYIGVVLLRARQQLRQALSSSVPAES